MAKVSETKVGDRFGKLVVCRLFRSTAANTAGDYLMMAECVCDCGAVKELKVNTLGDNTNSCGCWKLEVNAEQGKATAKHGMVGTKTYRIWRGMWTRTTNPNSENYRRYSSFKPPDRWKEFEKFLEDMGECPDGYSLERIKNDEGYGPNNCEWIPLSRQARNRSTTVWVVHEGQKLTLKEAAELAGLDYGVVRTRRYRKWSIEQTLGSQFKLWEGDDSSLT